MLCFKTPLKRSLIVAAGNIQTLQTWSANVKSLSIAIMYTEQLDA